MRADYFDTRPDGPADELTQRLKAAAVTPVDLPDVSAQWRRGRRRTWRDRGVAVAGAAVAAAMLLGLYAGLAPRGADTPPEVLGAPGPPPAPYDGPLATWVVEGLGVRVDVPAGWTAGDDPLTRSGPGGSVAISVEGDPVADPAARCSRERERMGGSATVRLLVLHGESACTVTSADGTEAVAVVPYPRDRDAMAAVAATLVIRSSAPVVERALPTVAFDGE